MIQLLGHFGRHGFDGGPGFGHGFHAGPGIVGGPGFDGSFAHGPYAAGLFGSHLMGLVTLAAIGIAIWFFATGRHRSLATAGVAGIPTAAARAQAYATTRPADIDPAEEVARERFARGDITAEEYATIIATLRGHA